MVFFVVVTYNSKNYITKCLDSIRLFESSSKIIVVDNYSQDNTLDLVRQYKDIIIFENNENLGFGKANNIGIQHAMDSGAEYIYLLNHDAYLVESVIQKIKVCFQEDLNCGIISPIQLGQDESSLELNFSKFLFEDGTLAKMAIDGFSSNQRREIYHTNFIQAASWMIRVDVIKRVGLFNPLFFHYGEDNEYLNRLKYHGFKVGILTNCRVVHLSNPLSSTHKKNFNVYHQNRVFSNWLVSQLDINLQNDKLLLLRSVSPMVRGFLLTLFTLRFAQAFGRFSVLLRIFRVMHLILPTRNMYK